MQRVLDEPLDMRLHYGHPDLLDKVHFLTRGYGGSAQGPLQVRLDEHDAGLVGDEAMMLAAEAPTWVAAARGAAAAAACASTSPPQL